jgi:DNA-binding CsgD family transcriptional regulator/tetratricopeptide (TPR) repeat protein
MEPVFAALMAGDIGGAVSAVERAVAEAPGAAVAHELLGGLAFGALDDYPRARRHVETAYRAYRDAGDLRGAARCAIVLAQIEGTAGNLPGTRGWLSRAKRLIDEVGACVEEGYYRIALVGCEVPDVVELERSAARALELAREYRDTDLEIRAIAESGLALISLGRIAEGVVQLDEAAAAVVAGEVRNLGTKGLACCTLVSACDRLGDTERLLRLREGLERLAAEHFRGFQPPILMTHCRQAYGGMLGDTGRWQEAEAELLQALELSHCAGHRASAIARLARLRIHQNRIAEAGALLRGWEDRLEVAAVLAELHDAKDELDLAALTIRWALREQETDLVSTAPLWAYLADLESRRGDVDAAEAAAARLESIAQVLASPAVQALALLARGRTQLARGEEAESTLVAALLRLRDVERPLLRGEIHLTLTEAKRHEPSAAITEARAALAIFDRIGARRDGERAVALLRGLGVKVPTGAARPQVDSGEDLRLFSRRETEVLALLAEGRSNVEIAARLFISPKTVEHHVSSILGKLGLRTRTEVAAWAAHRRGSSA